MLSKCSTYLIPLIALLIACASSKDDTTAAEDYPDLVQLTQPSKENVEEATIYVDSVNLITVDERPALLVKGHFPDGCTRIGAAEHDTAETVPTLRLEAWRDPDIMCTQALVSFSFIYRDFPEQLLSRAESLKVNSERYSLQ